jgi:hypothetical protein
LRARPKIELGRRRAAAILAETKNFEVYF